MSENDKTYEVGYGKPPKKNQFKKGKSGNPKGRKKGVRNFATLIRLKLEQTIVVQKGGTKKRMTAQEVVVEQLIGRAMKGEPKALEQILKFNPKIKGQDLSEEAEKAYGLFLDSMTTEDLDNLIEELRAQTQVNQERNKKLREEERQTRKNRETKSS
jgi:hypothetical protein